MIPPPYRIRTVWLRKFLQAAAVTVSAHVTHGQSIPQVTLMLTRRRSNNHAVASSITCVLPYDALLQNRSWARSSYRRPSARAFVRTTTCTVKCARPRPRASAVIDTNPATPSTPAAPPCPANTRACATTGSRVAMSGSPSVYIVRCGRRRTSRSGVMPNTASSSSRLVKGVPGGAYSRRAAT